MTVKVLCECGTKFVFDIEPVGGKMPAPISCPSCARDATEAANEVIAAHLGMVAAGSTTASAQPVQPVSGAPFTVAPPVAGTTSMRVAGPAAFAPPDAPVAAAESPGPEMSHCAKHPDSPAAANCVVCNKPICLDCMSLFGYLCSAYCKGLASRKNIHVPRYGGMRTELIQAENKKGNKLLLAAAMLVAGLLGLFIWYNFYAAKPRLAWNVEAPLSARFFYAQWLGRDKIIAATTDKAVLYEAGSGKVIWESAFKADEKVEQKARTRLQDEDADEVSFSSLDLRARLVGHDLWVIFPRKAVRFDGNTGKRKQELALPEAVEDGTFSESAFLGIARPSEGKHVLARIDLNSGKLQSVVLTSAVTRVRAPINRMPTVGSSTLSFAERETDSFGSARLLDDRREFFHSGNSVVHLNVRLLEQRFTEMKAMREKTGPSIIDSGRARASQGLEAAEEFFNEARRAETGGVRYEDESRYLVNLRRPFGGGSAWSGEVVGPPAFFPLRNLDLLVAGKSVFAFSKSGQKLWEGKITYPLAPRFIEALTDDVPALEHGSKLYFFDQGNLIAFDAKNGQVAWRLQSVGISSVLADSSGKLYISTTTAGPEQIKYSEEISITSKIHPAILKVDSATGAIIWQKEKMGERAFVSGKFVYASDARVSGLDRFSAISNGGDPDNVPVHHRVYRLDSSSGKDLWEYYRPRPPQTIEPRQNRILLQYPNELRMVKFFSF